MAVRHYFLGANTGGGFVSVYDEFCRREGTPVGTAWINQLIDYDRQVARTR